MRNIYRRKRKAKQLELFDQAENLKPQIALEELFEAYFDCRKNKRRTASAIKFEIRFESELIKMWREINNGSYKIGRSVAFVVKEPVQREIFAANFRDRVIHHFIINKINHLFEELFIDDSYSCRKGKGTLKAVQSVAQKIKECSDNYSKDCYVLKMDIRSFFMNIDKNVLYKMLYQFLEEKYKASDKEIILKLIKQIIFNNPENNCRIKGKISDWNGLPCHKTLFWSAKHKGLPIGNLTSQIFANFYLDKLDKFITQDLGITHYARYVDDFIIVHQDKDFLKFVHKKIALFLKKVLYADLHPNKVYLQHYKHGVGFLGAFIKQNCIYIGRRVKHKLYLCVKNFLKSNQDKNNMEALKSLFAENRKYLSEICGKFMASINSYFGIMIHYMTQKLRCKIWSILCETYFKKCFLVNDSCSKFNLVTSIRQNIIMRQNLYKLKYFMCW